MRSDLDELALARREAVGRAPRAPERAVARDAHRRFRVDRVYAPMCRYKHHKQASKDVDVDFWRVCRTQADADAEPEGGLSEGVSTLSVEGSSR